MLESWSLRGQVVGRGGCWFEWSAAMTSTDTVGETARSGDGAVERQRPWIGRASIWSPTARWPVNRTAPGPCRWAANPVGNRPWTTMLGRVVEPEFGHMSNYSDRLGRVGRFGETVLASTRRLIRRRRDGCCWCAVASNCRRVGFVRRGQPRWWRARVPPGERSDRATISPDSRLTARSLQHITRGQGSMHASHTMGEPQRISHLSPPLTEKTWFAPLWMCRTKWNKITTRIIISQHGTIIGKSLRMKR